MLRAISDPLTLCLQHRLEARQSLAVALGLQQRLKLEAVRISLPSLLAQERPAFRIFLEVRPTNRRQGYTKRKATATTH